MFLSEEKNRTLVTLEKTALKWDARQGLALSKKSCPIIAEGAAAYAASRAHGERALRAKFHSIWMKTGSVYSLHDEGAEPDNEKSTMEITVAKDEDSDADIALENSDEE